MKDSSPVCWTSTTTELADEHVGGFLSAGPDRLTAAGQAGIPQVVSTGALDMANFYATESVPARFKDRLFYKHNANVTLMRTTPEENARIGASIAQKLSAAKGPVAILLPGRGVSAIDKEGQPFDDPVARTALHDAIRAGAHGIEVIDLDRHINDPDFADAAAAKLLELMNESRGYAECGRGSGGRKVSVDNSRLGILKRFREQIARGEPIIGGGAGTGLSAVSEEAGGIDLLIVYNSGRYRMAGRGSSAGLLAYGNANQIVKEMAYEVLPVVKSTPVLAGVNGTDPFIIPRLFLEELRTLGFAGIQNFPTVGLFDGDMRQAFEETGMSYQLEVDIIRLAREMDLLTTPYVFNPSEAERMAGAGADLIVAHMGVTTGGSIGAKSSKTLDDCVTRIQRISDAARGVNPEVLVICHGGPISEPPDAEYIITKCRGVDGFYGASSVERLPAERAIAEQIRKFKRIRRQADELTDHDVINALRFVTSAKARVEFGPWGKHWWLSDPDLTATKLTLVRVRMIRPRGHQFHYHPAREEIIYVLDGVAEQWVDREKRRCEGCDSIHRSVEEAASPSLTPAGEGPPVDCYDTASTVAQDLRDRVTAEERLRAPGRQASTHSSAR